MGDGTKTKLITANTKTASIGRPVRFRQEEEWLYLMYSKLYSHDAAISNQLLQSMLISNFPDLAAIVDTPDKLKGFFIYRWEKRYGIVVRRVSHSYSADETKHGEMICDFLDYYRSLVMEFNIPLNLIVNMDETAVDLASCFMQVLAPKVLPIYTVKQKGFQTY